MEDQGIYKIVTWKNIDNEDFVFQINKESYMLRAGEARNYPKFMVNIGLKHLIDKILTKRDKTGALVPRQDLRDELAMKMIIKEEAYDRPVAPTDEEIVEQMNKPSDLDRLLDKNKSKLKGSNPVEIRADVTPPEVTAPKVETPEVETDTTDAEHFDGLDDVKGKPTRAELMDFAKNTLKLDVENPKTRKVWDRMKVDELVKEFQYEEE